MIAESARRRPHGPTQRMTSGVPQRSARQRTFTEMLRGVRALRSYTRQSVARRMGVEPRSFERFEAGEVRLDLERMFAFAAAADCDPMALVAGVYLERPDLARRCADNKLMQIQAISFARLSEQLGERLSKGRSCGMDRDPEPPDRRTRAQDGCARGSRARLAFAALGPALNRRAIL